MYKWIIAITMLFVMAGCSTPLFVIELSGDRNPVVQETPVVNPQGVMAQPTLVTGVLGQPTTAPGSSVQPTATPGYSVGIIPGSTEAMPCTYVPNTGSADGQYLTEQVVRLAPGYYIVAPKDANGGNKQDEARVIYGEGFVSDENGLHWWTFEECLYEKLVAERNKFFPQSSSNN